MRRRPLHDGIRALLPAVALLTAPVTSGADDAPLTLKLRSRVEDPANKGQFQAVEKPASWDPKQTAIIVCDMWDLHHCLNAVRRGEEMAPTMDRVLKAARDRGVTIIHAPSDCIASYKDHPRGSGRSRRPRPSRSPPRSASGATRSRPRSRASTRSISPTAARTTTRPSTRSGRRSSPPWAATPRPPGRRRPTS